jgi:hypothetical protein
MSSASISILSMCPLSVDEKSQLKVLDRTPGMPLKKGHCGY